MDKLTREQATLQLMHLIKQRRQVAESLLPDRAILKVSDVESAAAKYRADKASAQPVTGHWFYK